MTDIIGWPTKIARKPIPYELGLEWKNTEHQINGLGHLRKRDAGSTPKLAG